MARFSYVAFDADGKERAGGIDAADEAAARVALTKRRLVPVSVKPGAADSAARAEQVAAVTGVARGALSAKQRLLTTRQLATLIDAAVPVDEALAMIAAQYENPTARRILRDVHAGVTEGLRLAEAMGRHPKSFSGLYRAAVAGGERAGKLGSVLNQLTDYLAKAAALRAKVTTALIYPAVLSFVALTVVICLMVFVVPALTEQFQSFSAKLPLLTQVLIAVSWFLSTFWPVLLGLFAGAVLLGRVLWRREGVRRALDGMALKLPLLGAKAKEVSASGFVRAVAMLTSSGLPVLDSVRAARGAVDNRVIRAGVDDMAAAIERGEPFSHAMRAAEIAPPMVGYMAASGESAGELPQMLEKAADHLDQEVEAFTARALSLLEPAIIVFMGGTVAAIVLSIMLPILQLNRMVMG
jgi:general secretion pathway protein F